MITQKEERFWAVLLCTLLTWDAVSSYLFWLHDTLKAAVVINREERK